MAYYYTKLDSSRNVVSVFVEPFKTMYSDTNIISVTENQYQHLKSRFLSSKIKFGPNEEIIETTDNIIQIRNQLLAELNLIYKDKIETGIKFNNKTFSTDEISRQYILGMAILKDGEMLSRDGDIVHFDEASSFVLLKFLQDHLFHCSEEKYKYTEKINQVMTMSEGQKILQEYRK